MDLYAIFYDVLDNIYYALLAVIICVTIYELIVIQYFRDEDSLRRVNDMSLPPGNDQDKDNERRDKDE